MTKRAGMARFPNTNYTKSKYCVAYLDILGSKNIICNDNKSEHLNTINMIYADAIEESKMFAKDSKQGIFVKIFSDNLLIAIKTDNSLRISNIEKILVLVSNIIDEAADYGYLIRGAITEGDFFHNDIFVYGKALIDVVQMEEEFAIYPRIIVSNEIAKLLPQYFYECADGWNIFNNYILNNEAYSHINFKITFLEQLKKNKDDKKVLQKIMWAITNFNFCSDYMHKMGHIDYSVITDEEVKDTILGKDKGV